MTKQGLNNLFFVIGVVAVVVMILTFDVSFSELWLHLCKAGYWLIPILGIWFVVYGLNALAWQSIIRSNTEDDDTKVSFWRIYRLTITGYALNYATPVGGLGGEPYRIMELSKNIGNQKATSSVILYAMMHFFAHFWLWFTSIFLYLALAAIDYVPMTPAIGLAMASAIVFCLLAFYIFSRGYKHGLVVKLIRWIGKIPGLKSWSTRFLDKHAEALHNIDAQIAALHKQDKRAFYNSLLLEYASRIVQSLEILFMLLLFGIDCGGGFDGLFLTFLYSILILSFTTLLANLIGFLPMQLGVQEGGFMVSIALIGMSTKLGSNVDSAALGIFVSIICRVREILWIFAGILLMKVDGLKRSTVKALLLLLVVMAGLSSCSNDDDDEPEPDSPTPTADVKVKRTVMIFMAGENNLTQYSGTRYLHRDFTEMIHGSQKLTDDQRLLVFIDSLNLKADQGTPRIVELRGGKEFIVKEFDKEFYSSDPAMFREVLSTMMNYGQSDEYGLVLWGHASGWVIDPDTIASSPRRAYGLDLGIDGNLGRQAWMNITQMARALEGLPKLKFIFADCCNMMCAEVGCELRHATDYLIGSPAEIPGDGAPYDRIVPYLYKDSVALYQGIIDTYFNNYIEAFKGDFLLDGYSVPLSVIDTRHIKALADKTHDVLQTFVPTYPEQVNLSSNTGLVYYWYYGAPVMYDMRAVLKTYAPADTFAQWDALCQKAVPYHRMSMKWMTNYPALESSFSSFLQDASLNVCVSMFVPQNSNAYQSGDFRFNATCTQYEWNRIMDWSRFGWKL